ncbi:DUF86 domain-containing protein [Aquimarina sp. ERC-38]|uniref:HepT-like ribonuclease domain-containing protein n=1 Tax=Aquimarina sp. ERC-38 TaxID=2949996 RepID=UPI002246DFAE|nr:HepT-like ribonuclease domain-containing protein [Aquimarina sp. ERC-38]UZO81007.1 DUF86 domain-containing protein [Aquimarina sp. ERC-38]
MQPKELKYILDLESLIQEVEKIQERYTHNYTLFKEDFLGVRSLERVLEIIGEALKKLLAVNDQIIISNSKRIISLRNILAHEYDNIDSAILWSIAIKDIPILKDEIKDLRKNS